ncbi:MAG: MAPEG family protein [Pseudomonadota bacterium]
MTHIEAAALYIALNVLLLLALAIGVVVRRRAAKVSLGDGGDEALATAIRVHGNASENIPVGLIILVVIALLPGPVWTIHAIGGGLTVGRLLHAIGLSRGPILLRQLGMALTWTSLSGGAGLLFSLSILG